MGKFCSPSSCDADPKQAAGSTLTTPSWIRVRTGTLVKDRPPHLMHADTGLRVDGFWLPSGGALRLRVGEVRRLSMCIFSGRLALGCARRCWACLAHRAPRRLARERLQWPQLRWGLGSARASGEREVLRPHLATVMIKAPIFHFPYQYPSHLTCHQYPSHLTCTLTCLPQFMRRPNFSHKIYLSLHRRLCP